jgi:hypothetical protein
MYLLVDIVVNKKLEKGTHLALKSMYAKFPLRILRVGKTSIKKRPAFTHTSAVYPALYSGHRI